MTLVNKNNGIQNEYDFVELFNNKKINDLDNNSQKFLKELFNDNIDSDEIIIAWKNRKMQKADIFIKYKNYTKGVSIKCGNGNSVHNERIEDFKTYLESLNIPYNVIEKYVSYHYGYMRDANGKFDYSKSLSSDEYKKYYQNEINDFNKSINKTKIIVDMVDRFIIRGKYSNYDIDAMICGTANNYIWIMKDDLYDLVLSKKGIYFSSPHAGCMTFGSKNRNLNRNPKYAKDRYIVCVRWNGIRDDIKKFKIK